MLLRTITRGLPTGWRIEYDDMKCHPVRWRLFANETIIAAGEEFLYSPERDRIIATGAARDRVKRALSACRAAVRSEQEAEADAFMEEARKRDIDRAEKANAAVNWRMI